MCANRYSAKGSRRHFCRSLDICSAPSPWNSALQILTPWPLELQICLLNQQDIQALFGFPLPAPKPGNQLRQGAGVITGLTSFVSLFYGILVVSCLCPKSENRCFIYFVWTPSFLRQQSKSSRYYFITERNSSLTWLMHLLLCGCDIQSLLRCRAQVGGPLAQV